MAHQGASEESVAQRWSRRSRSSKLLKCWRPEPESNRRARICSPLRNHSAIGPPRAKWAGLAWLSTGAALAFPHACRPFPGAKRAPAGARFRLAAALPGLRGGDRGAAPFLPRLLVGADLPWGAVL